MGKGDQRTQTTELNSGTNLIVPGKSVGQLNLGDTKDRTFEIFPIKQNTDEYEALDLWNRGCGTWYNWVDFKKKDMGNINVRFLERRVIQIESITTRFHTAEAISIYATPAQVRRLYKNLKAYVLRSNYSEADGGVPVIFWVDETKGIAFSFATTRKTRVRYLYSIIVFSPGSDLCPRGVSTKSDDWIELKPYSLNPSSELMR